MRDLLNVANGSNEPITKPARRRLPKNRFDGLPLSVKRRKLDADAMEEARARGYCEWCNAPLTRAIAAHARPRAGQGDDTRLNLCSHCQGCELAHHAGGEPTVHQMLEVARLREAGRRGDWHPRIIGSRLNLPRTPAYV